MIPPWGVDTHVIQTPFSNRTLSVAGVNRGLEGLACDVFNQLVHIARKIGDPVIERSVDFVLADEITHVRMGSKSILRSRG